MMQSNQDQLKHGYAVQLLPLRGHWDYRTDVSTELSLEPAQIAGFPALAALNFQSEDLAILANQGFVCVERRGNRIHYKLRYRYAGRQHVKYVGSADRAAAVQGELGRLQVAVRMRRELRGLVREARQMLRASKSTLKPLLESRCYGFHGLEIRRRQQDSNASFTSSSNSSLTRR